MCFVLATPPSRKSPVGELVAVRTLIFIAAVACAPVAAQAPEGAPADSSEAWDRGLREQAERALRRLMPIPSFADSLRMPAIGPGDSTRRRLALGVYAADPDNMPVWMPDTRLDAGMVLRPTEPVPYMPGAARPYQIPDSLRSIRPDSLRATPDSLGLDGHSWMKKRNE